MESENEEIVINHQFYPDNFIGLTSSIISFLFFSFHTILQRFALEIGLGLVKAPSSAVHDCYTCIFHSFKV